MPDVAIIGGGVMGLAAAREFRRRGLSVMILERGQPGRAASWASAGIVGAPTGPRTEPGFQLQALSRQLWPNFAATLQEESGLDPAYREMGCLTPALTDEDGRRDFLAAVDRDAARSGPARLRHSRDLDRLPPNVTRRHPDHRQGRERRMISLVV